MSKLILFRGSSVFAATKFTLPQDRHWSLGNTKRVTHHTKWKWHTGGLIRSDLSVTVSECALVFLWNGIRFDHLLIQPVITRPQMSISAGSVWGGFIHHPQVEKKHNRWGRGETAEVLTRNINQLIWNRALRWTHPSDHCFEQWVNVTCDDQGAAIKSEKALPIKLTRSQRGLGSFQNDKRSGSCYRWVSKIIKLCSFVVLLHYSLWVLIYGFAI